MSLCQPVIPETTFTRRASGTFILNMRVHVPFHVHSHPVTSGTTCHLPIQTLLFCPRYQNSQTSRDGMLISALTVFSLFPIHFIKSCQFSWTKIYWQLPLQRREVLWLGPSHFLKPHLDLIILYLPFQYLPYRSSCLPPLPHTPIPMPHYKLFSLNHHVILALRL